MSDRYEEIAELILARVYGIYPPDYEPEQQELEPLPVERFTGKPVVLVGGPSRLQ